MTAVDSFPSGAPVQHGHLRHVALSSTLLLLASVMLWSCGDTELVAQKTAKPKPAKAKAPAPFGTCAITGWCAEAPLPLGSGGFFALQDEDNALWAGGGQGLFVGDATSGVPTFAAARAVMPTVVGLSRVDDALWAVTPQTAYVRGGIAAPFVDTAEQLHAAVQQVGHAFSPSSVFAVARRDVWLGGSSTRNDRPSDVPLVRFDGDFFVPVLGVFDVGERIAAIHGFSSNDVWLVGAPGLVMRFNGVQYSRVRATGGRNAHDVWGSSPQDVWIAADGVLRHFDGNGFADVLSVTEGGFIAVHGYSANAVWALSSTGQVYFGSSSSMQPVHTEEALASPRAVLAISERTAFVADAISLVRLDIDDAGTITATRGAVGAQASLTDVAADGATVMAVGDAGTALVRGASSFELVPTFSAAVLRSVDVVERDGVTDAFVVGDHGTAIHLHREATSTESASPTADESPGGIEFVVEPMVIAGAVPSDVQLTAVYANSNSDVWATGAVASAPGATLWHSDGGDFVAVPVPAVGFLDAIDGHDDTRYTGGDGVLAWDGAAWQPVEALSSALLFGPRAIHVRAADDVWFATDGGLVHFDGTHYEPIDVPFAARGFVSVAAINADEVWATDVRGDVYVRRDGAFVLSAHLAPQAALATASAAVWAAFGRGDIWMHAAR